jgi:uncharacterized protein
MPDAIGPIPLPEPGQKAAGFFTFDDPLLGKYRWPYVAAVGREPGLRFLLTAGIHAAEYTGVLAAIRLGQHLDPAHVRGTLLILPLLNVPGFYERSIYVNPEDNQNLNRAFPGNPEGSWSERFAHHLLNDIVLHVDRDMDLHAGDMIEDLEPFVGWRETGNAEVDRASRQMLDSYGVRWATVSVPSPGRAGMLYATAAERGIPAVLAESGRCGLPEEPAIQRHVDGVLNIWRTLGLLTDEPPRQVDPPRLLRRNEWLRSEHEGVFLCRVHPGQHVQAGELLGQMIDLLGNHLADITSPLTGVVLFTVTSPAIKKDGLLLSVAAS